MHVVDTEDIAFVCIIIIWSTSGVGVEIWCTVGYPELTPMGSASIVKSFTHTDTRRTSNSSNELMPMRTLCLWNHYRLYQLLFGMRSKTDSLSAILTCWRRWSRMSLCHDCRVHVEYLLPDYQYDILIKDHKYYSLHTTFTNEYENM